MVVEFGRFRCRNWAMNESRRRVFSSKRAVILIDPPCHIRSYVLEMCIIHCIIERSGRRMWRGDAVELRYTG